MENNTNNGQSAAKFSKLDKKYVGKTFGIIKVINFSHQKIHRKFYKILCLKCNTYSILRSDAIMLKNRQCCINCANKLQSEIAQNKYKKLRKYRKIYNQYKNNAKVRNLDFKLILEDIIKLVNSNCHYCDDINSKGIDRLNNDIGYCINNVVPCCKKCNFMKNKYTFDEFYNHIEKIYKFMKKSSTTIPKGSTQQAYGCGKGKHPNKDEDIV